MRLQMHRPQCCAEQHSWLQVPGTLPLVADRPTADDRAGGWSADEEQKFMEALRLCGKDMRGISQQMGTRSTGAVKSFFNKHRK